MTKFDSIYVKSCNILIILFFYCLVGNVFATEIYYYRDKNGVLHFSDRRIDSSYRVFAIYKNFPGASKARILRVIGSKSRKYKVDPLLIEALVGIESAFNPGAVSGKGALGLMQIMPATGKKLGLVRPHGVEENIEAGIRYFKDQLERFGKTDLALAAYNAGPAAVEKYGGIPPYKETRDYVRKVLKLHNKLKNTKLKNVP